MKFLECPYCYKQAVKLWEIFVFPSRFWLDRTCGSGNNKIKVDFNTVVMIGCSLLLGLLVGLLIGDWIPDNIIFPGVFLLVFACVPIFFGRKLFLMDQEEKQLRSD
jgi:hypothetical protein